MKKMKEKRKQIHVKIKFPIQLKGKKVEQTNLPKSTQILTDAYTKVDNRWEELSLITNISEQR
jgi:hypothetical protein